MTRPKKSLGQNFLQDEAVVERIVNALDLRRDETVVEIGPGHAALTNELVKTGARVVAIEIDRELVPELRTRFYGQTNFSVIEADVLEVDFSKLDLPATAGAAKLVGNLPYYVSTAILQKLGDERRHFSKLVLMLQREVAGRITALPGRSERGFLTVLVEAAFDVERLVDVPPEAFDPQPKVWSSVVKLKPKPRSSTDEPEFRHLLSMAFGQKRKTILNNLKRLGAYAEAALQACGIDPKRRAETLSLTEWTALYEALKKAGRAS